MPLLLRLRSIASVVVDDITWFHAIFASLADEEDAAAGAITAQAARSPSLA